MPELNEVQLQFIKKYLGITGLGDTGDLSVDFDSIAKRTHDAVAAHPEVERVLLGLLRSLQDAVTVGDSTQADTQMTFLTDRLDTLDTTTRLPDIKSVVEMGLAEASRQLLPEDPEVVQALYEEARTNLSTLPDSIRDAAVSYEAELNRLRIRGDALVARLKKGEMPPNETAAHHSEVDQICIRLEEMTSEFHKLLASQDAL